MYAKRGLNRNNCFTNEPGVTASTPNNTECNLAPSAVFINLITTCYMLREIKVHTFPTTSTAHFLNWCIAFASAQGKK